MKYDIFVSYRRTSFESARLIAEQLRSAGFTVFFDVETLRSGKFNEQLYKVIEKCNDFIVVLPENALDRCSDEEDWVRRETCYAMQCRKNIIPVMLANFTWPDPMPQGMEELRNYQAITATSHEYFDLAMKRLLGYLKSKPHKKHRKFLLSMAAVVIVLVVCAVIGYFSFRLLAIPVCTETGNTITQSMGVVSLLGDVNANLYKDWNEFYRKKNDKDNPVRIAERKSMMYQTLEHYQKETERLRAQKAPVFELSDYRTFLLGLYNVNTIELQAFTQYYHLLFDAIDDAIDFLRSVLDDDTANSYSQKMAEVHFEGFQYMLNALYYDYLEFMSLLPSKALEVHKKLAPQWKHYPNGTPMNLSREEYERFQEKEMNKYDDLLRSVQKSNNQAESDVEDLQHRLDNIEDMMNSNAKQREQILAYTEEQLEAQREMVKAKQALVEKQKQDFEDFDKEYVEMYEGLKGKYQLEKDDDPNYMWKKIRLWSNLIPKNLESRKQIEQMGVDFTSSITLELILEDLNLLLADFETYYPPSKAFLPSVKAFYEEIAQSKRPMAGVLVFNFKDDEAHPLLKVGDIIVGRHGKRVVTYQDLQKALEEGGDGNVTYLRLSDGRLVEKTEKMPETTVLTGFMELKE